MTSLHRQIRQILRALDFVNIDRLDELKALLEQRSAQETRSPERAIPKACPATEPGAVRGGFLDFLQTRGATLHVSGRSG